MTQLLAMPGVEDSSSLRIIFQAQAGSCFKDGDNIKKAMTTELQRILEESFSAGEGLESVIDSQGIKNSHSSVLVALLTLVIDLKKKFHLRCY